MLKSFNLNQNETDLLIKILKDWYCLNKDTDLFTPQVNKLLLKINSMNFKLPNYLYRAYSFEKEEDYKKFKDAALSAVFTTRVMWTFSAAYRIYPTAVYKKMADEAFRILLENFWDIENGGIYWSVFPDGWPEDPK